MHGFRRLIPAALLLVATACASDNDNRHTTATTVVPPPKQQVLQVATRPTTKAAAAPDDRQLEFNSSRPLLVFHLPDGKEFHEGEEVVIDFSLANAQLKGDGGEYRVRYIVDDEQMRWIDRWEQVVLTGWLPGKHTIRLELIGPDGWPYRNGDYNVVTRELIFVK